MERKRLVIIGILLFIFALSLRDSSAQGVVTSLNISNSGPILIQVIPNQSWASGYNLTHAFDLDDYFMDPNGDNISYSYSAVENITVLTDSSNVVSFYSDYAFLGIRNMTFHASDGQFDTASNLVFLFVGEDTEAPKWSSPGKNKLTVYQSIYVNFSADWTDNFWLRSYYLNINQGAGWVEYPEVNFSGLSNTSIFELQISAAPGTEVYWRICAKDSSLNENCTSFQNFTVAIREIPPSEPSTSPGAHMYEETGVSKAVASIPGLGRITKRVENFTIEPSFFKVSLKQGATETRVMKITNIGSSNLSFNLSVLDLEGIVFLSEHEFMISPGESKEVTVDFTASFATPPSQYFGLILVHSTEIKYVPLIIDVNSLEMSFSLDVEVPERYKAVMPGETVHANISLLNLKDIIAKNMTLYFAIKDFYGNIYDSGEEKFVFNSSLFFDRNLTVPEFAKEGDYIFYARAYCSEGLALDSDTFEVGERFIFLSSLKSSFVFILLFLLCFIALILMVVYSRSKEKERILSLYLMLNELKNLIKEDKFEEAVDLYIRIKKFYGEKVSEVAVQDRSHLKEEIRQLSIKLKGEVKNVEARGQVDDKKNKKKDQGEKKEESKEIKTETKEEEKKEEVKEEKKEEKEAKTETKEEEKTEEDEKGTVKNSEKTEGQVVQQGAQSKPDEGAQK